MKDKFNTISSHFNRVLKFNVWYSNHNVNKYLETDIKFINKQNFTI